MQPQQYDSILDRISRNLCKKLHAQIGRLQDQLAASIDRQAATLRELASTKNEFAATRACAERELARAKSELTASNERLAAAKSELTTSNERLAAAKRELIASNERAERDLAAAKSELAASNERANSLARSLAEVTRLQEQVHALSAHIQEQLPSLRNLLLGRFAEVEAAFSAQIPLLTANLAALRSGQDDEFRMLRNRLNGSVTGAGIAAADRFLDLLEASLTGTLRQDVSQAPWAKNVFDPARRAVGHDWPSQAETMIGTARMRNLRVLTQRALEEGVPGDLIETGVWRGGACIYMRGILAAAGDTNRRIFVADSFRGLPAPDEATYPADAGDRHHTFEQLAVPRAEVEANFRRYGLLDQQVVFLEGWFKDTLPTAPIGKLAILRLDGDMYESTMDALNALYGKVSPGGFVIIDDYVLKACAQAVNDFRSTHGILAPMYDVDGAAVWWQVPKDSPASSEAKLGGEDDPR